MRTVRSKELARVSQRAMSPNQNCYTTSDQSRSHIVSSVIVPSYISRSSSLAVRIVVDIAKLVLSLKVELPTLLGTQK